NIASLLSELRQTPPGSTSRKVRYRASHCGTISFDLPHQSVASAIFHSRLVSRIKNGPPGPAHRRSAYPLSAEMLLHCSEFLVRADFVAEVGCEGGTGVAAIY